MSTRKETADAPFDYLRFFRENEDLFEETRYERGDDFADDETFA